MTTLIKLALIAAAVAGAVAGMAALRASWIGEGEQRTQARWDLQAARDRAAAAEATAELQRIARRDETRRQEEAERIARENHERIARLESGNRNAAARNRSLLRTIARLNDRARDLPGADADASTGPGSDGAAAVTARELLGRCGSRYAAVAADAGRYAAQVIGLQQYAGLCQAQRGAP